MRIVAYHIGSLGDAIVTIPALRLIRRHFSSAEVILLYNQPRRPGVVSARSVLDGSGLVDTFVSYDAEATGRERLSMMMGVVRTVRRLRPSTAVYLAPSERAASAVRRDRVFFRLCGARHLVGFSAFAPSRLRPCDANGAPAAVPGEGHRKIERLQADGIGLGGEVEALAAPLFTWTPEELAAVDVWLATNRRGAGPLVSVAAGTNMPAKMWPFDRFVEVGRRLAASGHELVVVGGPGDHGLGERLITAWRSGVNAAGVFDLRTSGALFDRCAWHLGLDCGSTHLAAAAGRRCLTISSDALQPGQWDPIGFGHVMVRRRVACGGCRQAECTTPGHPCMSEISIEDVWHAIQRAGLV